MLDRRGKVCGTLIRQLQLAQPRVRTEQLKVAHPGTDDDGIWFFRHPATDVEVQLESSTGSCPFLVERTDSVDRLQATTVQQAILLVVTGLGLTSPAV